MTMPRGYIIECVGPIPWEVLHPGAEDWTKDGLTLVYYADRYDYWPADAARPAEDDSFIMATCARACARFGRQNEWEPDRTMFPWGSSFYPRREEPWGMSGEISPERQHARLYVEGHLPGIVAVSVGRLLESGIAIESIRPRRP